MKSLVDIMGGTISVKSELGKGTEFIVDLYVPLAEAEVEIANGTYHCHDSGCFWRGEEKDAGGRNELSPVQAHQPEDIV